jgi:hypothetical protein
MKMLKPLKAAACGALVVALGGLLGGTAQAQNLNRCAWPLTLSPNGSGNFLAPDDGARYWVMPFEKTYRTMRIQGRSPSARYFSFVAYSGDAAGRPIETTGALFDGSIVPESGGPNPAYSVLVSRDPAVSGRTNGLAVGLNDAWVVLRIYAPAPDPTLSGRVASGSVPLPTVTLDDGPPLTQCPPPSPVDGNTWHPVRSVNKLDDLRAFLGLMFPPGFDIRQPTDFEQVSNARVWFAPPRVPPILLFPNPHNKYILTTPGPYQPGRVLVIRARAPSVADRGHPGRSSAPMADLRYWSMCNNDFALPIAVVRCVSDQNVVLEGGHFTVVISDDLGRPSWLRPGINWLPWGDEQYPKLIFFRHLLAADSFPYSIQQVVRGCPASCLNNDAVFDFTLPDLPRRALIDAAGPAVQRVMGEYYPVAAWCDKAVFERGGWQACLRRS